MAGFFDAFRRVFGKKVVGLPAKPAPPDAVPSAGMVLQPLPMSQSIVRIGGSLTPELVSTIMRMADGGNTAPLCDLANDARQKDCTLQQCLQQREDGLSSLPWELVIPDQEATSTRGARQKRFVQAILNRRGLLQTLVPHLVGAVYPGFAVSEIFWVKENGKLVPGGFVNHQPRRFGFRPSDGALVWRDQGMGNEGIDFRAAHPNKFIVAQPRVNGDVAAREGLVRVLMWAALFRNWSLADWVKLGEIAWKPWRWAEYQKTATKKDIADLVAVLEGMIASGVAAVPETTKLHIEYPGGSGSSASKPGHAELYETMGREIAKAIVGQTLTTDEGKNGTQALGRVHNEVRKDIRDADALHVAMVLSRDLIAPMVTLNFGVGAPIPEFRFVTEEGKDLLALSTGLKTTVETGLPVPQKWAYELLGIPAPKGGEAVIEPPAKAPPPGETNPDGTPKDPEDDPEDDPAEPAEDPEKEAA